jgi:hypothetical protein
MEESFVVCKKCKGQGTLDVNEDPVSYVKLCSKCLGAGKLDWVENVVGKTSRSGLDDINVRRLMNHITKTVQKTITIQCPRDSTVTSITGFLEELRRRKMFYDYTVRWEKDSDFVDITIQPNKAMKYISLEININN